MKYDSIEQCPLFVGIDSKQLEILLNCLAAFKQDYDKDEFVFRAEDKPVFVGIILSGGTYVIQEDFWGNRTILAHISVGGVFGEAFSFSETDRLSVSVIASEKTEIILVDFSKIIASCTSACPFHTRLIKNMLRIMAQKNIILTRKIEHLSKRTIRKKLMSFLSEQAVQAKNTIFEIPFNRQELADYLCVERSALSRELANMQKDGLLCYDKKRFELK